MESIINRILKQSEEMQKASLRYYARCPADIKISILANKTPIFHKLRQENSEIEKGTLEYCAMVIAIQEHQHQEKMLSKKSFDELTLDEIEKLSDIEISKFKFKRKKRGQKGEFLLSHWAEVRRLKLIKGFSYREIADYFSQRYRDFEVSKSKVQSMWIQLEKIPNEEINNG